MSQHSEGRVETCSDWGSFEGQRRATLTQRDGCTNESGELLDRLEHDRIADLRIVPERGAGFEFDCLDSPEDRHRHAPRLQFMTDSNYGVALVEEYDIDREAHEKHVHPHEWLKAVADEEHAVAGLEAVSSEQSAGMAGASAGMLEMVAQGGAASPVDCADAFAVHGVRPRHRLEAESRMGDEAPACRVGHAIPIGRERACRAEYTPVFVEQQATKRGVVMFIENRCIKMMRL